MAVYIDNALRKFRNMLMCHMIADTVEELHNMADRLGLKHDWFQSQSFPHYDLSKSKVSQAVANGAILVTTKELALIIRRLRSSTHIGVL